MAIGYWCISWMCHEVRTRVVRTRWVIHIVTNPLVCSSKWTGALSVPIVWVLLAGEMWDRLCERRNKVKDTLKRLSLYGFTMLFLPCLVYYTIFNFHLSLVPNAGDHDLLVSTKLKYSLVGHKAEPSQSSK